MLRLRVPFILFPSSFSYRLLPLGPCPTQAGLGSAATRSSDLVSTVPQVYGPGGLVGTDNGGPLTPTKFHEVHFQASSINSFGPEQCGDWRATQPGTARVTCVGLHLCQRGHAGSTSFGPVLADRAETLGKRRIFVGASYEYFDFDKAEASISNRLAPCSTMSWNQPSARPYPLLLASTGSRFTPATSSPRKTESISRFTRSPWSAPMASPISSIYRSLFLSWMSAWA